MRVFCFDLLGVAVIGVGTVLGQRGGGGHAELSSVIRDPSPLRNLNPHRSSPLLQSRTRAAHTRPSAIKKRETIIKTRVHHLQARQLRGDQWSQVNLPKP